MAERVTLILRIAAAFGLILAQLALLVGFVWVEMRWHREEVAAIRAWLLARRRGSQILPPISLQDRRELQGSSGNGAENPSVGQREARNE